VLVAPRRASKASLAKDLPFHFSRRMGAAGVLGLVASLGLRVLSLALILALLLPLLLLLAMVLLLAFFALLALLATLLVNVLAAARTRPPPRSIGVGERSIESAATCRAEGWLAVSSPLAGGDLKVNAREFGALI
jgi:hypothetical protein